VSSGIDYGLIEAESGPATTQAIQSLSLALESAKIDLARSLQVAKDRIEPKTKTVAQSANMNNLALDGASVVHFTGASSVDLTGFVAPEPGRARVLIVFSSGAGTITMKHEVTSTAANRLDLITGADTTLVGTVFVYLSSRWRQVV
jgi:hypothetical protein